MLWWYSYVNSSSVRSFKEVSYWINQEVYYNCKYDVAGTGNHGIDSNKMKMAPFGLKHTCMNCSGVTE